MFREEKKEMPRHMGAGWQTQAEQQAEERAAGFIGASTFEGSKEGFVFTHGPHGLGYYPDQSGGTGDDDDGGKA